MDKHDVARILEDIALFLSIQGENPFKVRAYQNAARSIEDIDEAIETLIAENRLKDVPGVGDKIRWKIEALVLKGSLPFYEKLKKEVPPGLLELMDVPSLGAKKVKQIYDAFEIQSVEQLVEACENGQLSTLKGFGPKTIENILRNIENLKAYGKRMLWWDAKKLAYAMREKLSKLKQVKKVEIAGSFRRKLETVGDLDFLVASNDPEFVMNWFSKQPSVEKVQARGPTKSSVRLKGGLQADLRVVPEEEFAYALLYFTGSKDFDIFLRQRANQLGFTLNEYGMQPLLGKRKKNPVCKTEEAIFQSLKLSYIPPELREGAASIDAAEKGKLPKLVEEQDLRGTFHCHTADSDGHNTLTEMAAAAEELKWEYLGIADHSKSSYQANGMDEKRLFNQIDRIKEINQSRKFKVYLLAGLECDILNDGTLDFPNEVLKHLDYVITSVHRSFKMSEKEMTARLIKAIENPFTTMIGHVTGRLLLRRDPYLVNLPKIIDACIANGKIIELNAYPSRLDMDWRFWHHAAEKGLMCSINPDAHSTDELQYCSAGINCARKGWLEKKHILNTFPLAKVKSYLLENKQNTH